MISISRLIQDELDNSIHNSSQGVEVREADSSVMYLTHESASKSLTFCGTTTEAKLSITSANIREHSHLAEYPGSTLVIIEISENWKESDISRLGSFVSAFISGNKLRGYSVVVFRMTFQELLVKRTLALVCPTIEMAYYHSSDVNDSIGKRNNKLTQTVKPVVIGHWIKDRTEGFRGYWSGEEIRSNIFCYSRKIPADLLEHLILHYTLPGDYISHIYPSNGNSIEAALGARRNIVYVHPNRQMIIKAKAQFEEFKKSFTS